MPSENDLDSLKLEQGKTLTKLLFKLKETNLKALSDKKKQVIRDQFPLLSADEFHNVIVLVSDAKNRQKKMIALHMMPRDVSIIVVALMTWLTKDWKIAVILGAFSLISLVLLSNVRYDPKHIRTINIIGWIGYLAILAFGFFFYQSGVRWNIAVLASVGLWGASLIVIWAVRLLFVKLQRASKTP